MQGFISNVGIMRYLLLEPFHGAAGDMITGALLSLGADHDLVAKAMRSVVSEPTVSPVRRAGILATRVETHAGKSTRTLEEVIARLKGADAPGDAREMALRVFQRIAAAEESVHGSHPHFHEVGADDAVADIIGACTALGTLGLDGVAVTPVAVGGGTVSTGHGHVPVPAPATLAILEKSDLATTFGHEGDGELCTPTGAALLAEFSTMPRIPTVPVRVIATGYGAGSRDSPDVPNVIRATLIETAEEPGTDIVDILETNLDDVNGEIIGNALAVLMEAGARDASVLPCTMKKGRPGNLVRVICRQEDSSRLAGLMARELGTLGIRCIPSVHRFVAHRTTGTVRVVIGGNTLEVPVKFGWIGDCCYSVKPEFDEARRVADETGTTVRDVVRIVEEEARKRYLPDKAGEPDARGTHSHRKP